MVFHSASDPHEREFDRSLRPGSFDEFVGQEQIRDNLRIAIQAATGRGEPLDHVLLCGPPGLGKTTLAHLIAQGMASRGSSSPCWDPRAAARPPPCASSPASSSPRRGASSWRARRSTTCP
ncbi:MAG TPA: AAA family ATPase, partial [bacterium]|nr:AAA family ATPase [bacterium]